MLRTPVRTIVPSTSHLCLATEIAVSSRLRLLSSSAASPSPTDETALPSVTVSFMRDPRDAIGRPASEVSQDFQPCDAECELVEDLRPVLELLAQDEPVEVFRNHDRVARIQLLAREIEERRLRLAGHRPVGPHHIRAAP